MASVITRTEKGLPLTTAEADNNLISLETDVNVAVKNSNAWIANSAAVRGDILKHLDNYYLVVVSGTTSSSGPVHVSGTATNGTASLEYYQVSSYTPADILNKLGLVDGVGSGLDSDMVDGLQPNSSLPTTTNKSSIVSRDNSGNFSANNITANFIGNVTGNASSSTLSTNTIQLNGKSETQIKEEILAEAISISIALG